MTKTRAKARYARIARAAAVVGGTALVLSTGARTATLRGSFPHLAAAIAIAQSKSESGLPDFPDIVDSVKPSVIAVRTTVAATVSGMPHSPSPLQPPDRQPRPFAGPDPKNDDPGTPNRRGLAPQTNENQFLTTQGSGFFISADGYAVTNTHVIGESKAIEIQTDDGAIYTAKVVGTDPVSDLALIKVQSDRSFTPVKFAEKIPRVGEWVLAIGNPFGLGGTVTAGIVSARSRNGIGSPYQDLVQIDAPVNPGNSGGPTFDQAGEVIGVNTMIVSPTNGSIGIAFAIPIDTVKTVVADLKEKGFVSRGWLGVLIAPALADRTDTLDPGRGATIVEAQPNGPAAKAGLTSGDLVTSIDDEPVESGRDLIKKIGSKRPGTTVKLGVKRNGKERTIVATLGEVPVKRPARAG